MMCLPPVCSVVVIIIVAVKYHLKHECVIVCVGVEISEHINHYHHRHDGHDVLFFPACCCPDVT